MQLADDFGVVPLGMPLIAGPASITTLILLAQTLGVAVTFAALVANLVLVVLAGPLLSPYAPNAQLDIIALRSQAPSLAHPFGTDAVSRDVLSRVLDGGRVSLALAILSVSLSLVVGTLYGALSTLAGGAVDTRA